MMGVDVNGFIRKIAAHQNAVNPASLDDGDYIGDDGLIVCGVCGRRKQTRIEIDGEKIVVPCICKCREDQLKEEERTRQEEERIRMIRDLKVKSLMSGKFQSASFDRYVHREENEKAFRVAKNYAEKFPKMMKANQGLLFYGPVGTGKSYTAACIANALLGQAKSVIMTSFVQILQDCRREEAEGQFLMALSNASLVIIDDLGAERNTDYALEKVYNVIDSRIRANKPLILTTNLKLEDMEMAEDIRYQRIYDRIFEVCYPVEVKGGSFRMTQAAVRQKYMESLLLGQED